MRSLRAGALVFMAFLTACARLAGLEGSGGSGAESADVSSRPGSTDPAVTTPDGLPPPPPQDCGDALGSDQNCGFCGHVCENGAACVNNFCPNDVVVKGSDIRAFATDGAELFWMSASTVQRCAAAGPQTQTCTLLVSDEAVGRRVFRDEGGPDFDLAMQLNLFFSGSWAKIQPTGIAMGGGRVFVSDNRFGVVFGCPTGVPCDENNLSWVDGSRNDTLNFTAFGASDDGLAFATQDELRFAPLPAPGGEGEADEHEDGDKYVGTSRVLVSGRDLFWLSQGRLHGARAPNISGVNQLSARPAVDVAVNANGVFLATSGGMVRVERTGRNAEAPVADGAFVKVAADDRGVFATREVEGGVVLSEIRGGQVVLDRALAAEPIVDVKLAGDFVYFATATEIRRIRR